MFILDLNSYTVSTVPTPEMHVYGVKATLGDDVYHEPSTMCVLPPGSSLQTPHRLTRPTLVAHLKNMLPICLAKRLAYLCHLGQRPTRLAFVVICINRRIPCFAITELTYISGSSLEGVLQHSTQLAITRYEVSGISYNSHAAVTPVVPSNGAYSMFYRSLLP